jgi:hypothetical protein
MKLTCLHTGFGWLNFAKPVIGFLRVAKSYNNTTRLVTTKCFDDKPVDCFVNASRYSAAFIPNAVVDEINK